MPSIKLEESLLSDSRFMAISQIIGQTMAIGQYVRLTFLAQYYWSRNRHLIPKKVYNDQQFPAEFVKYDLVDERKGGFYLRGSELHFKHLFERSDAVKDVAKGVAEKNKKTVTKKIELDFLDEELTLFVKGVSDRIRSRWLKDYLPETIERYLERALEWCKSKNKTPTNVAGLMNKFFEDVPKDNKTSCPLSNETQGKLNKLLED